MKKILLLMTILLLNRCTLSNMTSSSFGDVSPPPPPPPSINIPLFTDLLTETVLVGANPSYSIQVNNKTLRLFVKENNRAILYSYHANNNTMNRSDLSYLTKEPIRQVYYNVDNEGQECAVLITTPWGKTNFHWYRIEGTTVKWQFICNDREYEDSEYANNTIDLDSQGIIKNHYAGIQGSWYTLDNTKKINQMPISIESGNLSGHSGPKLELPSKDFRKVSFFTEKGTHNMPLILTFFDNNKIGRYDPYNSPDPEEDTTQYGQKSYPNALSTGVFSLVEYPQKGLNKHWFTYNPTPDKMSIVSFNSRDDFYVSIIDETIIQENIPGKEGVIVRDQQNNLYLALFSPHNDLQVFRSSDNFQTMELLGKIAHQNDKISDLQLLTLDNTPIISYIDNGQLRIIKLNPTSTQNSQLQAKIITEPGLG
ncbi:MAG: hypothetical protein ACRC0X_04495, partial [Brevinema sp.]